MNDISTTLTAEEVKVACEAVDYFVGRPYGYAMDGGDEVISDDGNTHECHWPGYNYTPTKEQQLAYG